MTEKIEAGLDVDERISDGSKVVQNVVGGGVATVAYGREYIINQISEAQPSDIQKIAASQIKLLDSYYTAVLAQATASFRWALIAAGIGLMFFLGSIVFLLNIQTQTVALISGIGGTMVEVISGINFYLYGQTTKQLAYFHQRLDQTQRFLLANSICESLNDDTKQKSRAELVSVIATFGSEQSKLTNTGNQ